jgi:hypothetical protein
MVIATLFACWALPSTAADSPARLVEGERSIEELVSLPRNLEPGRYTVHCEAHIMPTGNAPQAFCYPLEEPAPIDLVQAVTKAAARATYVPAVRAGRAVQVYAVLMVLVDTTLAEPMILAVPNNGVEMHKYGLLYTTPQRLLNRPTYDMPVHEYIARRPAELVMMRFQIDEHGTVSDFNLQNISGADAATMRRYEKEASEYKFLPGYHDGRALPMLYVEPRFFVNPTRARWPERNEGGRIKLW